MQEQQGSKGLFRPDTPETAAEGTKRPRPRPPDARVTVERTDIEAGSDGDQLLGHSHYSNRAPWLRALVLGANDGLVSTSALLMGVGAGSEDLHTLLLSGVAGLVSGALSMACGEYISVASQRDAEKADIRKEVEEQRKGARAQALELEELSQIYVSRGLPYDLAHQVAVVLTETDVIRAHARDELGIDMEQLANPLQASLVSAVCFSVGSGMPLLAAAFIDNWRIRMAAVSAVATLGLAIFGCLGAVLGGANLLRGAARVVIGGWLAMGAAYGVGSLFNVSPAG